MIPHFDQYLEEAYGKEIADRYRKLIESPAYRTAKGGRSKNYRKPIKGTPRKKKQPGGSNDNTL